MHNKNIYKYKGNAMAKAPALLVLFLLSGCVADEQAPVANLPPPSRHDALESPAVVKTSRLQYGQGSDLGSPDHFAPIIVAPGPYPTEHDALHAFQRANAKFFAAYRPHLLACGPGALDGPTGRVAHYPGKPVVHCATVFFDSQGRQLGQIPVNYFYHGDKWLLRDPGSVFASPLWARPEPTLAQVRGHSVQ